MPLQDQARAALRVVVDLNASVVVLPYDADVVRQQYCGGPGVDPVALDRVFDAAYHQADPFCCGVFHWSGFGVGHSIRRVSALVRRRSPPSCLPGPRPHWSVGAVGRFRDRAGCRDHDPQLASRYSSASEEIAGSLVRSRTLARGIESMTFDIVALIFGFVGLALVINRNTMQLRRDIADEVGGLRRELGGQVEALRTEMNRRFDEASMESTRRFDMLGRDTANLRERMARVEERGGISPEPRDQNAA